MNKCFNILLFVTIVFCLSKNLSAQTLTLKDRWNIKCGYSLYSIFFQKESFIIPVNQKTPKFVQQKRSNVRMDVNYAVSKCLEIGTYIGFMNYPAVAFKIIYPDSITNPNLDTLIILPAETKVSQAFAPTFGFNVDFHLLPFFVKKSRCRWDLYLSAKYGGCYLTKVSGKYGMPVSDFDTDEATQFYRHEYGVGAGGSVYFRNVVGLYTEFSVGQYSYWPRMFHSHFNWRGGIVVKFYSRKKTFIY